jgi:beta-galactosidase
MRTAPPQRLTLLLRTALTCAIVMSLGAAAVDIHDARVETANGVPRLMLNGAPLLPLMFFPNTDISGEWSKRFLREQVTLAGESGVHVYSFPFRVPRKNNGKAPDYAVGEAHMQAILAADPEAVFLLRMYPGPWPYWSEWADIPEEHLSLFADGSHNFISIASMYFWELSNERLTANIRHIEASPFGKRVLGYHLGGPEHEMFADQYRERGPDYSPVNQKRFRQWLRERYGSDAALQQAWGDSEATLATAGVPTFETGRFPMHGITAGDPAEIFYRVPEEQDWIDYSRYCSDIASERILDWAKLVKKETDGRKLTAFFYGYTFELCGSFSGHYRLDRVLACPDVDVLASPYSYSGRRGGEPGGFMCPLDSITAHGKLWFNEDDTRTSVLDLSRVPEHVSLYAGPQAEDLSETLGMLERNLGAVLTHRAGTWWMDLLAGGAFNSPELWASMNARMPLFQEALESSSPSRPDVAILVDEISKTVVKSDWDANFRLLITLRNETMRSGAAVGFYSLADFVAGVVPPCKAYVFANAFCLDKEQTATVRSRLDRERATAIWLYAPGCFGPEGFDAARAEAATGIRLAEAEGNQGSRGTGLLDGQAWGWPAWVAPRLAVDDAGAEVIGRYTSDDAVSAAQRNVGTHRSVYLGDMAVNEDVLRVLFRQAGAHIWTRGGEVVHTDGRTLIVHCGQAGPLTVHLPEGVRGEALDGTAVEEGPGTLVLQFDANETVWIRLFR